jgi:hypothetical protein
MWESGVCVVPLTLNSELGRGEWSASRHGRITPGLGGPQEVWIKRNFLPVLVIELRFVDCQTVDQQLASTSILVYLVTEKVTARGDSQTAFLVQL